MILAPFQITFIVKFWSTSIEMISSDTMKEESLIDYKDLISKLDTVFISAFIIRATWNYLRMRICVLRTWKRKRRKCLLYWNHKHSNNVCEQIHSYNIEYNNY